MATAVPPSVWSQQVVTREIFTCPQPNPGTIVNCINRDDRIRIRERNLARRTCRRRCVEEQIVKQALGVWCSQMVSIATPMQAHVKRDSGQTW